MDYSKSKLIIHKTSRSYSVY